VASKAMVGCRPSDRSRSPAFTMRPASRSVWLFFVIWPDTLARETTGADLTAEDANAPRDEPVPDDWESPPPSVRPSSPPRASDSGAPEELPIGTVVGGRYEVNGVLGKGGFGVVYDAKHVELETPVALKVLRRRLTEDARLFGRFQQEARSSAAIGHPNIVQVFDLGKDEHGAYIAMEKLEGEELADRLERDHPLPEALVARIGAEVADAMAAAHERGVIHRDLKPQNVFLARVGRRDDMAKVIDFGIAKLLHRVEGDLTQTGQLFGTPRFMAPEQLRGAKNVDERVDVYAIGALLYRALTGAYPYDGETYPELLLQIMSDTPPPISRFRPDLTERMAEIIDKAMAKRPDDRFANAGELAEALYEHAETAPTDAPTDLPEPVARPDRIEASTGPLSEERGAQPAEAERPPTAATGSRRSGLLVAGGALALGIAAVAAFVVWSGLSDGGRAEPAPVVRTRAGARGGARTRDGARARAGRRAPDPARRVRPGGSADPHRRSAGLPGGTLRRRGLGAPRPADRGDGRLRDDGALRAGSAARHGPCRAAPAPHQRLSRRGWTRQGRGPAGDRTAGRGARTAAPAAPESVTAPTGRPDRALHRQPACQQAVRPPPAFRHCSSPGQSSDVVQRSMQMPTPGSVGSTPPTQCASSGQFPASGMQKERQWPPISGRQEPERHSSSRVQVASTPPVPSSGGAHRVV